MSVKWIFIFVSPGHNFKLAIQNFIVFELQFAKQNNYWFEFQAWSLIIIIIGFIYVTVYVICIFNRMMQLQTDYCEGNDERIYLYTHSQNDWSWIPLKMFIWFKFLLYNSTSFNCNIHWKTFCWTVDSVEVYDGIMSYICSWAFEINESR